MANIDPVGSIADPMLLHAWRQAQLGRLGFERRGAGTPGWPESPGSADEAEPVPVPAAPPGDGFHPGHDSFLGTLQGTLRRSLSAAGPWEDLVARLADRLAQPRPEPRTLLESAAIAHPDDLGKAIAWLVDNLDRPHVVSSGCAQLGPALGALLHGREQLDAFGLAVLDALRSSLVRGWLPEYDTAWRSTWNLAALWMGQGLEATGDEPPFWTGVVVSHDRRRADVAVLQVRTYLPYPFHPGQFAVVEPVLLKQAWRPCWIASVPSPDNIVELHVQANAGDEAGELLVHRTAAGDPIRLRPAGGSVALAPSTGHDLLLIAEGVGVAPMKALLAQLRQRSDQRVVHLFWGVRHRDDLYDLAAMRRFRATVVPAVAEGLAYPYASGQVAEVVAAHGDWHSNDVYVTGSPAMVSATLAMLAERGVPPEHIVDGTTESLDNHRR